MQFKRAERHEAITYTSRKQAAFNRKLAREQQAMPLFADQIAQQQHSWDEEKRLRDQRNQRSVQRMRDLYARQWRKVRKDYYALAPALQAQCKARWHAFWGPKTPANLAYFVDQLNGALAARIAAGEAQTQRIRQKILAQAQAQTSFE
ncbi:hypothetical protein SAMN04244572_04905 [Azotobacter beijerinckii]|uniref:Uncharacterized protein n=1 Tax=Azotobacter beijerinckii TaxID=170623 RepID=A0A1H6ZTD0_9GAMM|nr:hypothetical protein [Azotobacter beijerinckii]SEJ56709.1 hypothetical protein SAMN04244579_04813 [Azotobacter beijerinckii]SEJ68547.1 hypothetical protein SAMN04244572_04905 [Azotobacter beijerinckii]